MRLTVLVHGFDTNQLCLVGAAARMRNIMTSIKARPFLQKQTDWLQEEPCALAAFVCVHREESHSHSSPQWFLANFLKLKLLPRIVTFGLFLSGSWPFVYTVGHDVGNAPCGLWTRG